MERISILLAEDHAVVREGTREMLEKDPGLVVVAEAADGAAVLGLAEDVRPDVVLLDLNLPVLNGIEVARRLRDAMPSVRVLVLSAHDDEDYVMAALSAGAGGYLLKTAHASEVVAAIHSVARGEIVLDRAVARRILARARNESRSGDVLTEREIAVLRLTAKGLRTKEMAVELSVSTRTIEAHLTSIFNKLGVSSRTEAVLWASSRGWLSVSEERPLS